MPRSISPVRYAFISYYAPLADITISPITAISHWYYTLIFISLRCHYVIVIAITSLRYWYTILILNIAISAIAIDDDFH